MGKSSCVFLNVWIEQSVDLLVCMLVEFRYTPGNVCVFCTLTPMTSLRVGDGGGTEKGVKITCEYDLSFELTEILVVRHVLLRQSPQIVGISLAVLLLPLLVRFLNTRVRRLQHPSAS
jgi:hypothetical protein